jgi:outer membrane receptor for ferric coprogen and ferric-rhodotorulic acid
LRNFGALLAGVAVLVGTPALANPTDPVSTDGTAPQTREDEVIVLGKSYGQEVGKTVTPRKDVPNTISVIDHEQIEAQNLFTLEDALTATPGVTVTGVGSEDPTFLSRGFAISNYLIDGVPTLSFGFPSVVPDLFAFDRLEVLRGPAGLFSGSGNPAGSINMVRKRPLEDTRVQTSVGYGSYQNLRAELDISVPLSANAGLRSGLMVQDQDQFYNIAHRNRVNAFVVGSLDIGERTTITVGGTYDRFKPAVQSGLPGIIGGLDGSEGRLLDVPRSTYLGADWNRFRSDVWTGFAEITHQVSDRWTLRATGLYTDIERIDVYSYIGSQPVTPTNGLTNHIAYRGDSFGTTHSFDFNGIGSFRAFGREQTLILGADYQASDNDSYFTRLSNYARIDVYNPVSPVEPPLNPYGPSPYYPVQGSNATCPNVSVPVTPAPADCVLQVWGGSTTQVEQYGIYGQMRLSPIEGLTLIGGGRLTWWDTNLQTLLPTLTPQTGYGIEGQFTPYAGVVWDVTGNLNLYASYADSFTPQAAPAGRTRPDGQDVQPLIGAQFEVGSKLALFNDRLLLSGAVYQIEQSNRIFTDESLPTTYLQLGKVRARGAEFEASGEILPAWRINAGYSYTKSKYIEDTNPVFEGLSLMPVIPEHQAKLFTNYAPDDGALAGFSLGGGFTWFGETSGGNPSYRNSAGTLVRSTLVRQGAYAVADLRAGYKINERISLGVNVNNLFDRTYYSRISATGRGNYYGSPRTVFGTLRVTYP